jgi:hypothetical protein
VRDEWRANLQLAAMQARADEARHLERAAESKAANEYLMAAAWDSKASVAGSRAAYYEAELERE